ncbi:MAG: elongation factor P-like protein YeiP [Pseudomonadales bacterium]|nr:elongation factor P-like protein YeiP [Pseudomonadales bacterium]
MIKASDLKKGMVVEINNQPHIVKNVDVKSPSSRGASTLYKFRFNNIQSHQKVEQSVKGDEIYRELALDRRAIQFSYIDGEDIIFMDIEDYTQYSMSKADLVDELFYLSEGIEGLVALLSDGGVLGVELPQSVILQVTSTAPGLKGATASGRTKPATLNTGLVIQVPEYMETDEMVKVNTSDGKFMSRA